jgi:nucleoside phosphorylase
VKAALFAAFPQETTEIIRNLRAVRGPKGHPFSLFLGEYSYNEIIVVLAGMGSGNTETALEYILKEYKPDFVFSIGFGGALYDGALIGEIVWGSKVLLIRNGISETIELLHNRDIFRRLPANLTVREGNILTLERWMKKSEIKEILQQVYSFPVCDMETFFLAKLSREKGVPFISFRSITDRADEEIPPEFLHVTDESGKYRLSRALRMIFSNPKLIPNIIRTWKNSVIASNTLWRFVKILIEVM